MSSILSVENFNSTKMKFVSIGLSMDRKSILQPLKSLRFWKQMILPKSMGLFQLRSQALCEIVNIQESQGFLCQSHSTVQSDEMPLRALSVRYLTLTIVFTLMRRFTNDLAGLDIYLATPRATRLRHHIADGRWRAFERQQRTNTH